MDMGMWPSFVRTFGTNSSKSGARSSHEYHDVGREQFDFEVSKVKSFNGLGLIVVGTVTDGAVHFGDKVKLCASEGDARLETVDGIKRSAADDLSAIGSATAGEEVGLLFRGAEKCPLQPGDRICSCK